MSTLALAVGLRPELSSPGLDVNDSLYHVAIAERMADAFSRGENPFDHWLSDWGFGYPVARTYQTLAHLAVVALHVVSFKTLSMGTSFVVLRFLTLVLLPLSFFAAARLFGRPREEAAYAAVIAPLVATWALFGIDLDSYVFRGSGLFAQAVAVHLLVLSLGFGYRAVVEGRSPVAAGLVLGLTFLAHFIYGYIGAVSLVLLAALPAEGTRFTERGRRLAVLASSALVTSWYALVPLLVDRGLINKSRWEPPWKWDSWGAAGVLSKLFRGEIFDFGRPAVVTLLVLAGCVLALRRGAQPGTGGATGAGGAARFLGAGFLLWLGLFFGRPFWGGLLPFFGLSDLVQLHRLVGGVHVFGVFLAAFAFAELLRAVSSRWGARVAVILAMAFLLPALRERFVLLRENARYIAFQKQASARERGDLDAIGRLAAEGPGRAYAGLPASWGGKTLIGVSPLYNVFTERRIPAVSFLYHAMGRAGDLKVLLDDRRPKELELFGVGAFASEKTRPLPEGFEPAGEPGRFHVGRRAGAGFFALVNVVGAVPGAAPFHETNAAWLASDRVEKGEYLLWGGSSPPAGAAGRVVSEHRDGEVYEASVSTAEGEGDGWLLFRMAWHPNWTATVNGVSARVEMLTPGFCGVRVPGGSSKPVAVRFVYVPEGFRNPLYFLLSVLLVCVVGGLTATRTSRSAVAAEPPQAVSQWTLPGVPVTVRLLCGFTALYFALSSGFFFSVDEVVVHRTAESAVTRRSLDVPAMNTSRRGVSGSYYSHRGAGLGFVALPFAAAGTALDDAFGSLTGGVLSGSPRGVPEHPLRWGGRISIAVALLLSALLGGACVALLFLIAVNLGASVRAAWLLALSGGLATPLFSESTHFFQHPLEALCLLLGLYFLTSEESLTNGLLAGTALGLAVLTRPNAALAVLVLLGFAWARSHSPRRMATLAAPLGVAVALVFSYNALRFGGPLSFGYNAETERFVFDASQMATAVAGYVASPALSVFLFAPPLLLCFAALRSPKRPAVAFALIAVFAVSVAFLLPYRSWHGAVAYGPRFLLAPILLLLLVALPAFEGPRLRPLVLLAAGLFVQLSGVLVDVVVNEWRRTALSVNDDGAFVFSLGAAPLLVHLTELFHGRNLAPWMLRAFVAPGFLYLAGLALFVAAFAFLRKEPAPADRIPSRLPVVLTLWLALSVLFGFVWIRRVAEEPSARVATLVKDGDALAAEGRAVAASERYAIALGLVPHDAGAVAGMRKLLLDAKRAGEARALLTRDLALTLGKAAWDGGRKAEALGIWQEAQIAFPQDLEIRRHVGLGLYDRGDFAGAEAAYRAVAEGKPGDAGALLDLAWALVMQGKNVETQALCEEILRRDPGNAGAKAVLLRLPRA